QKISLLELFDYPIHTEKEIIPSAKSQDLSEEIPILIDEKKQSEEFNVHSPLSFLFSKYDSKDLIFLPTVTEPHVTYHLFTNHEKISKYSLQKQLIEKWKELHKTSPSAERINYFSFEDNFIITTFNNEYFPILHQLMDLSVSLNGKNLKIPAITSADLALAEYVIHKYELDNDKIYLIVYIGLDSSRMIFIKNSRPLHISGHLSVEIQDEKIHDILASRIYLEMYNSQIQDIHKIFFCGELTQSAIMYAFYSNFPESGIEIIDFKELDKSTLQDIDVGQVPVYALPIVSALSYLSPQSTFSKSINLLPKDLLENQKIFKLGWIGTVLLILIFIEVMYFSFKFIDINKKIDILDNQIASMEAFTHENSFKLQQIDQLNLELESQKKINLAMDTLAVGSEKWVNLFDKIKSFNPAYNNLWILNISGQNEKYSIEGIGLNRTTIFNFAKYLDNSVLKNITNQEIREKFVKKFEIKLNPKIFENKIGIK
ncbi:MAG: hypothetical protein N3A61_03820, partial [Ignavibacteria bacterium]|nr:hypothetical protein [Ignavibacteria bacterium]